jgi:ferredoxin
MDAASERMNTAILLCRELELEPEVTDGTPVAVIADLCHRPAAAAAAMRQLGAGRVVLGLCEQLPSSELIGALLRAGAEPFGIEPLLLRGHEPEAPQLLAGAVAKLARLAANEHGKPTLAGGGMSRRALFSPHALLRQAPVAVVDETACLGSARCGLCGTRCPVGAIDTAGPLPTVDEGACTACGACVAHCPAGALRLSGSSTAQIEAQLEPLVDDIDGVLFACRSANAVAPPGWALVELPTLALLTPAWILQTRARGPKVQLAPCDQPCCAGSAGVEALADLIVHVARAVDGGALKPLHLTEPQGTTDAVLALVPDGEALMIEHRASPLGLLEIDPDRCTLCGACSITCPTKALALDEGTSDTVLKHTPGVCTGCEECVTVCPEDALAVRAGIDVLRLREGVRELAHAQRERCMVCATNLPPAPMRRRMRELLPQLAGAPLDLCTGCASRAVRGPHPAGGGGLVEHREAN